MRSAMNAHRFMNRDERTRVVTAYKDLVRKHVRKGKEAFFINFMFNRLPGKPETQKEMMKREVIRFHELLTRNIVRKKHSDRWKHFKPILIGCPDYPVVKHCKDAFRDVVVNDGLHFNVLELVPPPRPDPESDYFFIRGEKFSRLSTDLKVHVDEHPHWYLTESLSRVHVTPVVQTDTMVDYTLKAFLNGRISGDDILIL